MSQFAKLGINERCYTPALHRREELKAGGAFSELGESSGLK